MTLTGDDPDDSAVIGYQILRRQLKEATFKVTDTGTTDTTFVDRNVLPGIGSIYRVKALGERNSSSPSAPVAVETGLELPPAPENLTATSTADSVMLNWEAPTDSIVTGYQILRKKLGERDLVIHVEDTGSADIIYVDMTGVEPDMTYVYRVKAINGAGVGKRSNFVRITTGSLP